MADKEKLRIQMESVISSINVHLKTPVLIRETSRLSALEVVSNPIKVLKKQHKPPKVDSFFLTPRLVKFLESIETITNDVKKKRGTYSNVLLLGRSSLGN